MTFPIAATTDSALAARLLSEVRASPPPAPRGVASMAMRAALRTASPEPAQEIAEPLALYTAGGRVQVDPAREDLVDAVGELLAAREGGAVDAARLRALHERTGTLLDVFA